ncbi:MAG: hypothetical protein HKN25_03095 [Pyrinomonadaceae bacterium]|nr:hypothetical protein [Pyrinomonadaceae bacterium]
MRNILSTLTIMGMVMLLGCQTASSSKLTKTEKTTTEAAKEKEVKKEDLSVRPADSADSHDHEADDGIKRISLEDAKAAFDKGDALFIDTRSKSAFENEHIKGAINIPWADIEKRYKEIPKDKTIIVYCS